MGLGSGGSPARQDPMNMDVAVGEDDYESGKFRDGGRVVAGGGGCGGGAFARGEVDLQGAVRRSQWQQEWQQNQGGSTNDLLILYGSPS